MKNLTQIAGSPWFGASCVGIVSLAIYAAFTHNCVFAAGNDASRFAPIESIVDLGHPYIDGSRYAWTIDRVRIDGHDYGNKPPLLALIGASLYWIIEHGFGLSFATNEPATIQTLTVMLVGVPTAALLSCFYYALATTYSGLALVDRLLATVSLGFGTILTSYVGTLSSHPLSALLVFLACWCAWRGKQVCAGTSVALLCCIESVPGGIFLFATAFMIYRQARQAGHQRTTSTTRDLPNISPVAKRQGRSTGSPGRRNHPTPITLIGRATSSLATWVSLWRFYVPLVLGFMVFVIANLLTVGSLLLPKLVEGGHDFGSGVTGSFLGVWLPDSASYPFACLFGWHGFFTVSPVVLIGVLGVIRGGWSGRPIPSADTWAMMAAAAATAGYHIFLIGAFGGWSFGFRYLIPVIPLLLFYCPLGIEVVGRLAFVAVLIVSFSFSLIGAFHPWPPGYEREASKDGITSIVTNPCAGNLAAFMYQYFPNSGMTHLLMDAAISHERTKQAMYLEIFFLSKGDIATARRVQLDFAKGPDL